MQYNQRCRRYHTSPFHTSFLCLPFCDMADTHPEPELLLSRAPCLYAMANRRDLHIHNIVFQFKDATEDEHYQSVLVPLDRPSLCTPALTYFYDDQAELEALCQCYYAKRTTGSMACFMRTNCLRGINSGAVPYVVSVFIEQYEGSAEFIPICHTRAAPRNVKVTSRGDRSRHITICLDNIEPQPGGSQDEQE